jgi:hypothetical protein
MSAVPPIAFKMADIKALAELRHATNEAMMTEPKENLSRHPSDRDILLALISLSRESWRITHALDYAERLLLVAPGASGLTGYIQNLRRMAEKKNRTQPSYFDRQVRNDDFAISNIVIDAFSVQVLAGSI